MRPCLVAITGADFDPQINGARRADVDGHRSWRDGDELSFRGPAGGRARLRRRRPAASTAIGGSARCRPTCLSARGGMHGRALAAGRRACDRRPSAPAPVVAGRRLAARLRPDYAEHTLHADGRPARQTADAEAHARRCFGAAFTVSATTRPDGLPARRAAALDAPGEELLSFGAGRRGASRCRRAGSRSC